MKYCLAPNFRKKNIIESLYQPQNDHQECGSACVIFVLEAPGDTEVDVDIAVAVRRSRFADVGQAVGISYIEVQPRGRHNAVVESDTAYQTQVQGVVVGIADVEAAGCGGCCLFAGIQQHTNGGAEVCFRAEGTFRIATEILEFNGDAQVI